MNTSFWKDKKVFITGHTGFKGGWLSLWLSKMDASVSGYALAPKADQPSLFDLAKIDELLQQSIIADIRDRAALETSLFKAQPEIVFHLAAQPLVRESYVDPITTFDTNVMGTANLLEAVRQCESVKAVIVVTSDKCYHNQEWHWGYRETEALGGYDPYSASKACTELVAQSWRQSFMQGTGDNAKDCAIATVRAGNVIGGGDWSKDRLIPDVLSSLDNNTPVILRNPDAIRPWQHVLEPLAGYMMLAEKLMVDGQHWAQAWNFGPHDTDARPVNWLVEQLIEKYESKGSWQLEGTKQPHEARYLKLDSSKARQELGWIPAWSLGTCLDEIAHWHQQWNNGNNVRQTSIDTLERYMTSSDRHA